MIVAGSACVFPFTDIDPSRLTVMLRCFEEIILYRLPGGQPDDALDEAVRAGRVRTAPINFFDDPEELERLLAEFRNLAALFREPGHLRQRFSEVDDERSGSRLMGLIRKGRAEREAVPDPCRKAQVVLHFARDLDRQEAEIGRLMDEVARKQSGLGDLMGVEALEEPGLTPEAGTLSQAGPDPNLLGRRLAAWARVYEARPQPGPLVTDQPEVLDALDLNLARMSAAGPLDDARGFEVLEPFCAIDIPLAEADKSGDSPSDWTAFIDRVSAGTWTKRDLDGLKKEAADLAAPRAAPADAPRSDTLHLTACLLPGKTLPEALALAAGVAGGPLERDVYCGPVFCVSSH